MKRKTLGVLVAVGVLALVGWLTAGQGLGVAVGPAYIALVLGWSGRAR